MHRPASLLVIDVQHGILRRDADKLVPEIQHLVSLYEPCNVYYLRHSNHPGSAYSKHLNLPAMMTSEQAALVPAVLTHDPVIFDHAGYSPPPELIERLRADGVSEIGICGGDLGTCVMAALFALWDHAIRPIVLSSYCFSSGGENLHREALDMMLRQFGFASVLPKRFAAAVTAHS